MATSADARPRAGHAESEYRKTTDPRTADTTSIGTAAARARFARAKPRQRAPTNACGRRTFKSRDHKPLQLRHVRGSNAWHAFELGDRVEGAVRLSIVEDLLRSHRADSG